MSDAKRELEQLRHEMSRLDEVILRALEDRAKAARRAGELRKAQPAPLPLGDRSALRGVLARATGALPEEALRAVFHEIHASCLALELPARVLYIGPEGGMGHAAARLRFGASAPLAAAASARDALDEVARKRAELAVLPFETQAEGPVHATIAALVEHELKIVEVVENAFELHLLRRTTDLAGLARVFVTPGDRARCEQGLAALPPGVAIVDVRTPVAACQAALEDERAAAVGLEVVGAGLGLEVARRNVADERAERARFAVVGLRPSGRSGADRTAIAFSVHDSPGALLDVLRQLAERGINLTKIQSRPTDTPPAGEGWTYLFFAELVGHATDRGIVSAFEEVKRLTKVFRVLGSYPG